MAGRQNFIIEPANSVGIHNRTKSAPRNANVGAKRGDSCELRLIRLKREYECKYASVNIEVEIFFRNLIFSCEY